MDESTRFLLKEKLKSIFHLQFESVLNYGTLLLYEDMFTVGYYLTLDKDRFEDKFITQCVVEYFIESKSIIIYTYNYSENLTKIIISSNLDNLFKISKILSDI